MTTTLRLTHTRYGCPKGFVSSLILIITYLYTYGVNLLCQVPDPLLQCFSNWVPQRGVRCSKRQYCIMGEQFYLIVLDLYVQIKIRVASFNTNLSITDSMQSITASRFCSQVIQQSLPYTVDVSSETIRLPISLRLANDCLQETYIKYKQILIFSFILDILWTGRSSSVSSVAFFMVP